MAYSLPEQALKRLSTQVRQFKVSGKQLLIPKMNPFGSRLLAASFRAYGVDAVVMDSYRGLTLGKEYTSGKECFPCQVTLGDILYHLQQEKRRLGSRFDPDRYVYFMPESDGPCRFGMYNKYQRLILDRFPELRDIPITYMSTEDGYGVRILAPEQARYFRRVAYVTTVIADILERVLWRVRPYEKRKGQTERLLEEAVVEMERFVERQGAGRDFNRFFALLEDTVATARNLIDDRLPRRPKIGIVGEIYLRTHVESNQDLVRTLERFGGEAVVASVAEWINYVTYDRLRRVSRKCLQAYRKQRRSELKKALKEWCSVAIEQRYQQWRQGQAYRRALRHLDIEPDHPIRSLEGWLDHDRHFNFDIGTEAALSIGGALAYLHEGFDGIVNVFPFTCMPSTICSAILKPLLHSMKVPYLDAPYDGTVQPNREIALRTFLYQAQQHLDKRLNGDRGK